MVKLKVEFILKDCVAHKSVLITDSNGIIFSGVLCVTTFIKVSVGNKLYIIYTCQPYCQWQAQFHIFPAHNTLAVLKDSHYLKY